MSQLSPKLWFLTGQFVDNTIVKRSVILIRTAPDLHLQVVQLLVDCWYEIEKLVCNAADWTLQGNANTNQTSHPFTHDINHPGTTPSTLDAFSQLLAIFTWHEGWLESKAWNPDSMGTPGLSRLMPGRKRILMYDLPRTWFLLHPTTYA